MTLANPQGASISEARNKLSGILSERPQEAPTEPQKAEEPAEKSIGDSETPDSDTGDNPRRFKAKLGEKDIEFEVLTDDVDFDQLPKGLMMESDYRKKTMSLAEERKAFESKQAEVSKKITDLEDMLMYEAKWLEGDEAKQLREVDSDAYLDKYEKLKSKAEKLKRYKDEQQEESSKKLEEKVKAEIEKYTDVIPEWLDHNSKNDDLLKMEKTLSKAGFSEDDLKSFWGIDHRLMSLFRKASLYDAIQSQQIDKKRVKDVPKSTKPSSTSSGEVEKTVLQKKLEKARSSGKIRDAQAAIKDILGG